MAAFWTQAETLLSWPKNHKNHRNRKNGLQASKNHVSDLPKSRENPIEKLFKNGTVAGYVRWMID